MTSGAPWSVKGIDPKAREIAKDLARRSGMTLGEWLNQVILEDTLPDDTGPAQQGPERQGPDRLGSDRPGSERRQAFSGASGHRRMEAASHPGDEVIGVREALDRLSDRIEAAEHRSTLAISGIDQSVTGLVSRLGGAEREQTAVAARFEGLADDLRLEQSRITERMRRIEAEAAGPRSAEALKAMEGALAKVATHLYEGDERTRTALGDLRADLDGVAERVSQGVAGSAATDLVDNVVARIAERLEQAEHRTTAALRSLESSFGQLDERLGAAERRIDGRAADSGLEQLAASLTARVEAARAEMAEKIRSSADDGRFDRMERTLQEMSSHVQIAERRSAEAIEKMGHEVLRMADVLGRKVEDVEHRSALAIDDVGGKVARIADAMENRLERVDTAGAAALEKLGGEIARITERLAERIADAERRSAQAIDDVGERVSRVHERMQDRQDRVTTELGDRIRLSEERTARLLEDARARIDERLAETNRRLETSRPVAEAAAPTPHAYVDAPYAADDDVAPFGHDSFGEHDSFGLESRSAHAAPVGHAGIEAEPDLLAPAHYTPESFEAALAAEHADEDLDEADAAFAAQPFAAHDADEDRFIAEHDDAIDTAPVHLETAEAVEPEAAAEAEPAFRVEPALTARNAAEADSLEMPRHPLAQDAPVIDPMESMFAPPPPPLTTRDLIQQARAASRAASQAPKGRNPRTGLDNDSLFNTMADSKPAPAKRKHGSTMMSALAISGAAAALSASVAGYVILFEKPGGPAPARVAEALSAHGAPLVAKALGSDPSTAMAALALVPGATGPITTGAVADPTAAAATAPAAPNPDAVAQFGEGARRIEAHDFTGVEALQKSANLGYAPAEFYLAKLYEEGAAGLKKDSAEARRWTERAAEGGDRKAMHNLALYYFEGTGGPKNTTTAAEWFHRAADLGLTDSQYNLGRLYEEGFGVAQNPAEAYKWYLIAAQSGDAESRNSAMRVKGQLSADAQSAAERAAQGFRAQTTDAPAVASAQPAASPAAVAQRALSRLGYYQGPSDGAASPALKFAIAAYQRDQGLPATGALDPALNDRLAMIAQ